MELYIQSKTNDTGAWLYLPVTEDELQEFLEENQIGEEYEITECDECDIRIDLDDDVVEISDAYITVDRYNELDKAKAITEYEGISFVEATEDMDDYTFYPDVRDNEDLGKYWLVESGCYEIPDFLENYIDFESFGEDNCNGEYTSYGYIERN